MWLRYLLLWPIAGALILTIPDAGYAGGRPTMSHGGVLRSPRVVIVPRHPGVHAPFRAPRAIVLATVVPFPVSPAVPFALSPPVIPEELVPPVALTPQPVVLVRRDVPVAEPKIVLPQPLQPEAPCSHRVVVYRGSKMEVLSFPISPCPAASGLGEPRPPG